MSKEVSGSPAPLTHEDVSRLRQTATDAASDYDYSDSGHASETKSQLKDLVEHFQKESGEHLQGIMSTSRGFITRRPLFCVSAALAVGILIGLSGSTRSRK